MCAQENAPYQNKSETAEDTCAKNKKAESRPIQYFNKILHSHIDQCRSTMTCNCMFFNYQNIMWLAKIYKQNCEWPNQTTYTDIGWYIKILTYIPPHGTWWLLWNFRADNVCCQGYHKLDLGLLCQPIL